MSLLVLLLVFVLSGSAWAEGNLHNTTHWAGLCALGVFVVAYLVVVLEEVLHIRKSQPVLVASGLIWILAGIASVQSGHSALAEEAARHYLLEFGELFLFLLAAMTFINTMEERGVFRALRSALVGRNLSLRKLFWLTGLLSFFLSPICDNLTTALLMGTVVMSMSAGNGAFVGLAFINVVVAANAGGAWSPFGDITTLMVWQKGLLKIHEFAPLFLPSLVNWLVPALLMTPFISNKPPQVSQVEEAPLKPGAVAIISLFVFTISLAVIFHAFLGLPPVLGMVTGLGLLKMYSRWLQGRAELALDEPDDVAVGPTTRPVLDIYRILEKAEWDTLLFFYGVIMSVGGLALFGYLELLSRFSYEQLGPTSANVAVGLISAVVDNIPVMVAVLSMLPEMSQGQWQLVTLTAGVGGSLLSVGSAAGVALMGQARGLYTFGAHLKWAWAVLLGYLAGVGCHLLLNGPL